MSPAIEWTKRDGDASYFADMPRNVSLFVSPDRSDGFGKPRRGTKWRYGASHWDGKHTVSRWGRDTYYDLCKSKDEAMRKAEALYRDPASGILKP